MKLKFSPLVLAGFLTLYACSNPFMDRLFTSSLNVSYTITFNSNDGSAVPSQTVKEGGRATRPGRPTRDGSFGFVNWYSDEDLTEVYDFNTPVYADITLYAKWGTPYTVTFNVNGGSAVAAQIVGEGGTADRPANPSREGYAFDNWYTTAGLTTLFDFNTPITSATNLYAKWNTFPVTNITGVPATATVGMPLTLTGTVVPANATNKTIVWSVQSAGTTGASISGSTLNTTAAGTVSVRATITDGTAQGTNYTQDFSITVNAAFVAVTNITGVPTTATAGTALTLTGTVAPANATNQTISWSVQSAGTTGATISGSTLNTTAAGTVSVRATITNGTAQGTNYTQNFTITVSAAPALPPTEGLAFTLINGGTAYSVAKGTATATEIVIPATYNGLPVTMIEDFGFYEYEPMTSINIPDSVTSIGEYAFSHCTNLALTSLPVGLISINAYAFWMCTNLALTSLPVGLISIRAFAFSDCPNLKLTSLPSGITSINVNVFSRCTGLTQMTLHEGITSIEGYAFDGCMNLALTSLPAGITSIGLNAFNGCTSLATITINRATPPTAGTTIFGAIDSIPNLRIEVPADSVATYKSTTSWSTYQARIFPIGFISTTTEIISFLNGQSGGTNVDNPIDLRLALDLGTMTQATSNWRKILDALNTANTYVNLDLSACTIEGGNSTIFNPDSAVATGKNRIVSITLPNVAQSILNGTWGNPTFDFFTTLKSFSGTGLKTIGEYAFSGRSSLTQTELPTGITSIGNYAFEKCSNLALTSLPVGLSNISNYAFDGCTNLALTSLPGITSIGTSAFRDCTNLPLTSLPAGLSSIGQSALSGCTSLGTVTCLATTPPTAGSSIFGISPPAALRIEVPASSLNAYRSATNWSAYADRIFAMEP